MLKVHTATQMLKYRLSPIFTLVNFLVLKGCNLKHKFCNVVHSRILSTHTYSVAWLLNCTIIYNQTVYDFTFGMCLKVGLAETAAVNQTKKK